MNYFPIQFLLSARCRVIVLVIVVLSLCGIVLYGYAQKENKLTFHQSWTEPDRRQMEEVVSFINKKQKERKEFEAEQFDLEMNPLSWSKMKDWSKLCEITYRYHRKRFERDMFSHWKDMVAQTARTGDASFIGKDDWTLLQLACALGKRELSSHLMDRGADVNVRSIAKIRDKEIPGDVPINWIVCGGMDDRHPLNAETVLFLMDELASHGADLNAVSAGICFAPFETCCIWRNVYTSDEQEKMILRLIDLGADVVSPINRNGKLDSPFRVPIEFGHSRLVRLLCEKGADVKENYGSLPLLFFIKPRRNPEGQVEIARILLEYGARINEPLRCNPSVGSMDSGLTPLSYLCSVIPRFECAEKEKKCFLDLFSLYMEKKADVNLASSNGMTPLMYIFKYTGKEEAFELRVELARMLLENGANPTLKNDKGQTVYDMIKQDKNFENEILGKLPALRFKK